ncbi:hypothetical protein XMIN_2575 [Xanthomonas citri pv. mangiferaeindicae LMG 941]|nr:hypothetical protein XMIN_2575 [Xanthomonas citri pv. mangiferaeindicae LMG 941]
MAAQIRHGIEPALTDQFVDTEGHNRLAGREAPVRGLGDGRCLGCHGVLLGEWRGHGTPAG